MLARWVEESRRGGAKPVAALSSGEREELDRLRREVRVLKMEREILKNKFGELLTQHNIFSLALGIE